jgi:FlaA1/EpsC-like NDP-sugar epimerase
MRIRLLGQYVPLSMAVLAIFETVVFFAMMLVAGRVRLGTSLLFLERRRGPLWPDAALFAVAMAACFLAFGLYSSRQRARSAGILIRVLIAVIAGFMVTAVLFYMTPSMWIGRGVLGIAAILAAGIVIVLRLGFSRFVDQTPFKRRVLVYGTGRSAGAISALRRRSDQRGL